MNAPTTELRMVEPDDEEVLVQFLQDPSNRGPCFPVHLVSRPELRRRIDANGLWSDDEGTLLIVCDGEVGGWISFFRPHRNYDTFEIAYIIFNEKQRKSGHATRALSMCTDILFRTKPCFRIELNIAVENAASVRVAEKSDYVREGTSRSIWYSPALGRRLDGFKYAITREAWDGDRDCPA